MVGRACSVKYEEILQAVGVMSSLIKGLTINYKAFSKIEDVS